MEDLLPTFADALEERAKDSDDDFDDLIDEVRELDLTVNGYDLSCDEQADLLERLTDALSAVAPNYVYFGAHPGDGSDFGFWVDHDQIEADLADGTLLKLESGGPLPDGVEIGQSILYVNDHGNISIGYVKPVFEETFSGV
jgi:hypothetical protein